MFIGVICIASFFVALLVLRMVYRGRNFGRVKIAVSVVRSIAWSGYGDIGCTRTEILLVLMRGFSFM